MAARDGDVNTLLHLLSAGANIEAADMVILMIFIGWLCDLFCGHVLSY